MPQQNKMEDRVNRIIVEMVSNMLHAENLNKLVWEEAVANAIYTRNRCPTRNLDFIMPEKSCSRMRPCIAHMHVFGRVAYAMVLNEKWGKFDAKDTNCLFLGYCKGSKAYRLMCLQD